MVVRLSPVCIFVLIFTLGSTQNYNVRHKTLQNMIDYTGQFTNQRKTPVAPQVDPVSTGTGQLEDDPFIKNLFSEFLVQYQQLAKETNTEIPTTTTTTEKPFKPDFPSLFTSRPINPVFPNIPTSNPTPQIRRKSPRRRISTPSAARGTLTDVHSSSTPSFLPVNSVHHESIESTTRFPSLRQRFFGVESSKPRKTSLERKPSPFVFQTTPAAPVIVEEVPSTTQSPKLAPNVKIPQRLVNIPLKPQNSFPKPPITTSKLEATPEFDEAEFRRQAESAKYEFASDIDDQINGNLHQREEVRDGLAVRGRYSFSDGYFKRTINYEADEKGYRVVKEEVEPLEGPQTNPDGQARVSSYVAGSSVNYQITKDDIQKRNQKTQFFAPEEGVDVEEV